MASFYIILIMASAALGFTMWIFKPESGLSSDNHHEQESSVMDEMNVLLQTIDNCAATEQERHTRYRDIRNKYKDTFAVLGYDFPDYREEIFN